MNWKEVFDAYPNAEEIFVVDNMPFLVEEHAKSHAKTTGKKVEKIERPKESEQGEDTGKKGGADTGKKGGK